MDISTLPKFPKVIEIQTTTKCNAGCTICPHSDIYPHKHAHGELELDYIFRIIDEIAEYKDQIDRVIPYWNNEPLLDKRILKILHYIKEKGLRVELSTNASLMNRRIADEILYNHLVDDLRISFFSSFKETYNNVMPGLNFDKTVKNINNLIEKYKNMNSNMKITINQVNYNKFNYLEEQAKLKELFGDAVNLHVFGYLDRVGNNREKNNLKTNEYEEWILNGCSLNRAEEWISITSTGDVSVCSQDWNKEIIFGNIKEESIATIFNNDKKREFLKKIYGQIESEPNFICSRCKLSDLVLNKKRVSNEN
ncbi:radical SAM protein [Staphylococcus cohnii]|uniref:radical SAM/SPASM domain-containing protein n=1 Tax=Staphylococcus nepalensis TaxID=214473 RepID=UPI001867307B